MNFVVLGWCYSNWFNSDRGIQGFGQRSCCDWEKLVFKLIIDGTIVPRDILNPVGSPGCCVVNGEVAD